MDKKTTIYVRNKEITPSSYYRIIQYSRKFNHNVKIRSIAPTSIYKMHLNSDKEKLNSKFIGAVYFLNMMFRVTFFLIVDIFDKPDFVILSKTFLPRYCPNYLLKLIDVLTRRSVFIWDFDDHIFKSGEISLKEAKLLENNSDRIIVTNDFLKDQISIENKEKVKLLPTTDGDLQGFKQEELMLNRKKTFHKTINLVWVATAGNLHHLSEIIETLDEAAVKVLIELKKELKLTVVCNKPLNAKTKNIIVRNVKWSRFGAKDEIYSSHIGIMPLINDEYSLGKGGFKLVQYISTGLPVIASNVGFNEEIINNNCGILVNDMLDKSVWIDAIIKIASSEDVWERYSNSSLARWHEKFSYDNNLNFWKAILNDIK
ncbi:MAG: glycosyltransferase [Dethiosulfatibacter sp.]|nr:glycosyltransferase [Dethiosulfatibacter sp.]